MPDTSSLHAAPIQTLKPTEASERYLALDVVRGLALLGVLIVNAVTFFRVSLFQHIINFHTDSGLANHVVDVLVAACLEFKAVTLFSLLFGVGISLQTERAAGRPLSVRWFLLRRFLVLLAFGLAHLILISNVDILSLYAVCGLLVIPFVELPAPALAALGLLCIAVAFAGPFEAVLPSEALMRSQAAIATHAYATGSYFDLLAFRWQETVRLILPLLLYTLPRTLGLMLLGMASWKTGVLRRPLQHRRLLIVTAVGAGLVGVTATVLQVFSEATGHELVAAVPPKLLDAASYMPLALAYAVALLLCLQRGTPGKFLSGVATLGQMALSNYLAQSVILSLIFYGYGAGLCGRLGPASTLALSIVIYLLQVVASRAWLSHYRFGPFEWIWRSLTYAERQPLRRSMVAANGTHDNPSTALV